MGWLALIRLAVIFALSFVALPVWAAKGQSRANPVRLVARSFIWLSFFLHFSIAILGAIRLALPGAVLLLYLLWIAALFLWGRPSVLVDSDAWRRLGGGPGWRPSIARSPASAPPRGCGFRCRAAPSRLIRGTRCITSD